MKDFPVNFWACMMAAMGCVVGLTALFVHPSDTLANAAFELATGLVTGGMGLAGGHAIATNQNPPQGPK